MTRRIDFSTPLFAVVALVLCVLVILPIGYLVVRAFTNDAGGASMVNIVQLVTEPAMVKPFLITLVIAVSVAIVCCIVAAPLGWIVARTNMPGRRIVRTLVTASFVTPPFLGAVAWEMLASPNSGVLNNWYRALFHLPADAVLFNIYSLQGVIFVISCYTFPYVFVLLANALDRIPGDLEDASSMFGANTFATARAITLPLVMPSIVAGVLVAFVQAMTLFGSPAILAMPAGFNTMTTKIWSLFEYPPQPGLAAAASLPLLIITIGLMRLQRWMLGRGTYTVVGTRMSEPRLVQLKAWKWPALALCLLVLCNPIFLPYGILVKTAFTHNVTEPLTAATFTLHNVGFVFLEYSQTQLALWNTLILCTLAATIGTALALVVGYLTSRKAVFGHTFLGFLATAPIAIPGLVLGVGLFLAYAKPPFALYGTLWILLLAYITIELPSAFQQFAAAFRGVSPELEEAGRILGASRLQTLVSITAPLLRSAVIAAWCFIFIDTMRELSAAIILFTANTVVLSVVIYDLNETNALGAIAVLGITMMSLTFVVISIANRFRLAPTRASA
jgi:iron(III) transport system permease protein